MRKLVTLEQAKKLKELGYRENTFDYFRIYKDSNIGECSTSYSSARDWNGGIGENVYARPFVSQALDWFREVKGIECGVFVNTDGVQTWYSGRALEDNGIICVTDAFSTHPEAESALLDALIEYVSK